MQNRKIINKLVYVQKRQERQRISIAFAMVAASLILEVVFPFHTTKPWSIVAFGASVVLGGTASVLASSL